MVCRQVFLSVHSWRPWARHNQALYVLGSKMIRDAVRLSGLATKLKAEKPAFLQHINLTNAKTKPTLSILKAFNFTKKK